jgi:triosephosphate isomerase
MPDVNPGAPRRTPVLAGNWKMNKGPAATRTFCDAFLRLYGARSDRSVWFFPPAIAVNTAVDALRARPDIAVGVQNVYWERSGAFTGETSAAMAAEAGARIVLVGHSERRHVFGETDDQVARKVAAALAEGLDVLVCVGETLEERNTGRLEAVLGRQLDAALGAARESMARLSVAYEPVWAIGTGVNATPDDAAAAHAFLRDRMAAATDTGTAANVPVLYGGSVNPDNARALLAASNVDGLLVGGASLKPESFAAIAATQAT